ncbi:MAG: flagellar hook-basal body complex protein FliE [Pseudomonadota bacterium]
MNGIDAISSVTSATQVTLSNVGVNQAAQFPVGAQQTTEVPTTNFGSMLSEAIADVDGKVAEADNLVARFVVDNTTPIHHVTVALEEARMAVELATQVRQRLTEGYRQLMNMQL